MYGPQYVWKKVAAIQSMDSNPNFNESCGASFWCRIPSQKRSDGGSEAGAGNLVSGSTVRGWGVIELKDHKWFSVFDGPNHFGPGTWSKIFRFFELEPEIIAGNWNLSFGSTVLISIISSLFAFYIITFVFV